DHTGSYAVPGDVINTPFSPPDDGPFATDLYFACMDGSSDWHPDMAHGRISPSNATEAQIIVDKIIDYEKTPPTQASFYTDILNCAQYQDDDNNGYADRRFCHTSENIREYLQTDYSYTSSRVYYTSSTASVSGLRYNNANYSTGGLLPAELRNASFDWSGGSSEITTEIDAGKFMVFHRDHGYVGGSGWAHPYYTTSTMTSLSNGDLLPVIFSVNCHTGEYQLSNCFAEKLLRMDNKGAVGVIAATYFSLSGWNDAVALGMIDAIWSDPGVYPVFGTGGTGTNYTIGAGNEMYTMGDVVNQGMYAMEQNWNGSSTYDKYEYELFQYFGDPAMKLWTSNPNSNAITATHDPDIDCSLNSFSITGSTAGAIATLVFDGQLIGETVLDGSGEGTISYSITGSGTTVVLTISKINYLPYVADLNLVGACNPPAVGTDPVTSIAQTTATLNGEILNDFGNTITESGFVYSTSVAPYIGGPGVTQIQTSPVVTTGTFSEPLSSLSPATTYYVKAYAISVGGTGYGGSEMFTTVCGIINTLPFTQVFNTGALPSCWLNIDNDGGGQVWAFTDPLSRAFNSTTAGDGYAILDSDAYGNGSTQDADLVTPEFDFSGYVSINLYFEHYFRSYSGSNAELFYSINGGSTWISYETYTATSITNPAVFDEDLTTEVAGESSVKFKWNYTGAWGYYWIVDDISITGVTGG
ncbi:MAG: choice-of-anchor J domain-containing protein, partial [Bacteroidales bacterium]|nr:choice-of-anchor J domain-containing protein [Bacteroidales bacterium]